MSSKLRFAIALLVGVLAAPTYADEPAAQEPAKEPTSGRLQAEVLRKYDANGNGKLDDDEKAKFLADRGKREPAANAGDENNRGLPAENLRKRVMERFDKDGDGKLSADERAAAEKARESRGKEKGAPNREAIRKQLDKDGDGKISDEERKALRDEFAKRLGDNNGPTREALMKRFDKDGDGKLSDDERQAMRRALQDRPAVKGKKRKND